jgi:hypothetical protein
MGWVLSIEQVTWFRTTCTLLATMFVGAAASGQPTLAPLRALGNAKAPEDPNAAQAPPDLAKPKNLEQFEILWAIEGASPQPLGTLDKPVPVGGNVRVLYESQFGRNPQGLEFLVGRLQSGNGRWRANYIEFLQGHLASIRQYLQDKPIPASEPWFVVIDWEAFDWSFNSENTFNGGTGSQPWRAAVREINKGQLDQDFLEFVQYETTAQTWDQLVQMGKDEELVAQSYTHFARDYVLRTLHVCRAYSPPETRWGFYFYPNTTVNPRMDRGIDAAFVKSHNELRWLWDAVDFLAPVFYIMPYRDSGGMYDPSLRQSSTALVERYYRVNMDEAVRVRDTYALGKPIVPFVMFYYHEAHQITVPYEQYYFLTPENAAAQMIYPRLFGADSLFLWGTVASFYVNQGSHQPLPVVVDHINAHWVAPFWEGEALFRQAQEDLGNTSD